MVVGCGSFLGFDDEQGQGEVPLPGLMVTDLVAVQAGLVLVAGLKGTFRYALWPYGESGVR
ncbi:MAG: hypothetical protein ACRDRO_11830 [Pseudonocardiaceae bacterium]